MGASDLNGPSPFLQDKALRLHEILTMKQLLARHYALIAVAWKFFATILSIDDFLPLQGALPSAWGKFLAAMNLLTKECVRNKELPHLPQAREAVNEQWWQEEMHVDERHVGQTI